MALRRAPRGAAVPRRPRPLVLVGPPPARAPGLADRLRRSRAVAFIVQCLRQSSIHGMGHISTACRRHPLERALWALVVALAWYGTYSISNSTWRRYQDNPTVIALERDYMSWNTTFPSLTLCPNPEGRRDPARVAAAVQRLAREFRVKNETSLRVFVERLAEATLYTLSDIPASHGIPGDRFLGIIEEVALPWNFSVVASLASDLASATYNPHLVPTMTELGLCFSFNSLLAYYVSPRYWRLGERMLDNRRGLLEVNVMDGSIFAQLSGLPSGYQLFVHGPSEVPDLQSQSLVATEGRFKSVLVTALAIHTSEGVRRLSPEQRRCRFTDEPKEGTPHLNVPVYSYNLCRRACRARLALDLCGCVPHLYGPMVDAAGGRLPTCNVEGIGCILGYLNFIASLTKPTRGEKIECNCLANCNEVSFVVDSDTNQPWFLGTDLKWGLSRHPRMRLKRDLIFGVTDLLVHVGSTAGLFLGCSVLSVIELLYFLTLRLYWYTKTPTFSGAGTADRSVGLLMLVRKP